MSAGIAARYRAFLCTPYVTALLATAVLARLPAGINTLAVVLFLQARTGSFAVAGLVGGALAIGSAIGAPLQGRLVDVRGARRVLLPLSLVHAGGLGAIVVLGHDDAGVVPMVLVAFVTGAALPPVSSVTRTLWPVLLAGEGALLNAAFALDSVLVELVFVVGPLLTAGVSVWAGPAAALVVSGMAVVVGTAAFTALRPVRDMRRGPPIRRGWLGALDSAGMRTLAVVTLPIGFAFGAVEITLPAYGEARGAAAWAGVLLGLHALGSAVGGLLYGGLARKRELWESYVRLAALLPLGFLPLALVTPLPAMGLLLFAAGAVIAPLLATGYQLVGDVAPAGMVTEAYTWCITALVTGIAAGSALTGVVVEGSGWRAGFLVAVLGALAGAVAALARRSTLAVGGVPAPGASAG